MRRLALAAALYTLVASSALAAPPAGRTEAITLYETMYLGSAGVSPEWTGNVGSCDPGDVSAAYRSAGVMRTDYFRIMAGLPGGLTLDGSVSAACQAAALMMTANAALSHDPPMNWTCYTASGADAAGKSNLALGYPTLESAVTGWMRDNGVPSGGHRRWILYPPLGSIGLGATFGGSNAYAMQVVGTLAGFRPAEPEWVAWPPPGWVPYSLAWEYWSLSYNNFPGADFSSATVSVTLNSVPLATTVVSSNDIGFGDNTLVWTVAGFPLLSAPGSDATYHVTVSNISGASSTTHEYDVILIDPSVPTPVEPTTWGGLKTRYLGEAPEGDSGP